MIVCEKQKLSVTKIKFNLIKKLTYRVVKNRVMEIILKRIFRKIFKRNTNLLRKIEVIYLKAKNRKYKFECEKRKDLDIFSIEELTKDMGMYPTEYYFGTSLYGIIDVLKEYSEMSIHKKFKGSIEHGLYLGNHYNIEEVKKDMKKILTYGEYRENILKRYSENKIYKIGPYIYYAIGIYSEEKIREIKKNLGKTLVFFPMHSIKEVRAENKSDEIIKELEKLKKEFKTIIICMYYMDIILGRHKRYQEKGYKIVCAGHKNDKYFLKRLRSIIEISDETASNGVGTHIGYSLCLGKGHFIINVPYSFEFLDKESKDIYDKDKISYEIAEREIEYTFLKRTKKITKEQKKVYYKYWGGNELKSKMELKRILIEE